MTHAESNPEWQDWGQADPFWGVASWPGRERGGANPWTPDEFYALGASDWTDFFRRWRGYGVVTGTYLEIGCGAGRLTKSAATDFAHVIGVDVAAGMIDVARQHVSDSNIEFRLGDGLRLPAERDSVDGVFSTHVFQHFASLDIARANIEEIARIMRPEGSLMIHLPVYVSPGGLPLVEAGVHLQRGVSRIRADIKRRKGQPLMRRLQYSWDWLQAQLVSNGFTDVELAIFPVRSNGALHPFVFARMR